MARLDSRATIVPYRTKRCRLVAGQADEMPMEQVRASVCKTFKYQLLPTREQEQAMETVVWRCCSSTTWSISKMCRVRNLVRNHHLAKRSSDAGWSAFRAMLEAKAACAGRQVIAVPPAYTSQDCSGVLPDGNRCPQRVAKSLSVRTHVCPCCGLVLDRDENAAQSILRAGQACQAPTWPAWPAGASVA